jgi:hypothetical protein
LKFLVKEKNKTRKGRPLPVWVQVTSLLEVENEFNIRSDGIQLCDINGRGIQIQGDKEPKVVMNQVSNGMDGKKHQRKKGGW